MNGPKKPSDVLGVKIGCINYQKCPLCFGCRNYNSSAFECSICAENFKFNICNTKLHSEQALSKFVGKTTLELKGEFDFE